MQSSVRHCFVVLAERVRRANLWRTAAFVLLVGLLVSLHSSTPSATSPAMSSQLAKLSTEVEALKQEAAMPGQILNQHRDSICYIYGEYSFFGPGHSSGNSPHQNLRFSGTGFVVAPGLIATNRHVVEPWYEDGDAEELIRAGQQPRLDKIVAFFPGHGDGVALSHVTMANDADVAVAHFNPQRLGGDLRPLPLAQQAGSPGDPVDWRLASIAPRQASRQFLV